MQNQHEQDARRAKAEAMARVVLETAREYKMPLLVAFPTNDAEWFRVWRMAKCASAPSEDTKKLCREIVEHWALVIDTTTAPQTCPDCGGASDADGEFDHQQGCGWGVQPPKSPSVTWSKEHGWRVQ